MRASYGPRATLATASFALMLSASACANIKAGQEIRSTPEGNVITAEQIRHSGATNGWEAVRRNGGHHLLIRQNGRDDDVRITHRGVGSLLLSNQVLVVLDGNHLMDWSYLREIPAVTIADIRVLSGPQATLRYGTTAGNGAIVVRTRPPGAS